jgi:hypothetical protein
MVAVSCAGGRLAYVPPAMPADEVFFIRVFFIHEKVLN